MAGKITHLEILAQTVKHLDHGNPVQKKIASLLSHPVYSKYANLGAVAPDIFYYYHIFSPIRSGKAQVWGDLHHHKNTAELILNFLDLVLETEEEEFQNRLKAFTFGYICHCAADIVTHPYIFYISGDYYSKDPKIAYAAQQNHMRVEFALDSFLLKFRWGMSPKVYDFNQHIEIRKKNVLGKNKMDSVLWAFWLSALEMTFESEFERHYIGSRKKIIPGDILNDSYLGYLQFHQILDSRSGFIRGFLKTVDFLTLNKLQSSVLMLPTAESVDERIMNEARRPWYYPVDNSIVKRDSFIDLVNQASDFTLNAMMMASEFLSGNIRKDVFLKTYGGYNLDTGVRNARIEDMKEFSPLV